MPAPLDQRHVRAREVSVRWAATTRAGRSAMATWPGPRVPARRRSPRARPRPGTPPPPAAAAAHPAAHPGTHRRPRRSPGSGCRAPWRGTVAHRRNVWRRLSTPGGPSLAGETQPSWVGPGPGGAERFQHPGRGRYLEPLELEPPAGGQPALEGRASWAAGEVRIQGLDPTGAQLAVGRRRQVRQGLASSSPARPSASPPGRRTDPRVEDPALRCRRGPAGPRRPPGR